ncbi:MAG: hypothetical protein JSW20_13765 [Nitrospiraceae bacterium]|nr:MAG: hypothetical protein JSW20_13765 [Nitrospiraceae bacterium]
MAAELKEAGLPWNPHAGCFVWDRDEQIKVPSPFLGRIYFILNLGRFVEILGPVEQIAEKLVWIPTWHQARELNMKMRVTKADISNIFTDDNNTGPAGEILALYRVLLNTILKN